MATLSSTTADNAHTLLDYQVLDKSGADIGTVHSFWADAQSGNLEFIGVKTGWLFGHNHVVPVDKVELDEAARTVHLPYDGDFIKGAMSIDADAEITDAEEAEIFRYYGAGGSSTSSSTTHSGYETETATGHKSAASYVSDAATTTGAAVSGVVGKAEAAFDTKATTATGKDTVEVPLTEESVKVGKRTVDAGQVRLRKIVRTEIVNQPVEIRHEDVVVERVSADQVHSGAATSNFAEEVIDVPLTREEVVVAKEAHVTGAVRLHKTEGVEQQTVSETVRKEDVEVVRDGKTVTETHDIQK